MSVSSSTARTTQLHSDSLSGKGVVVGIYQDRAQAWQLRPHDGRTSFLILHLPTGEHRTQGLGEVGFPEPEHQRGEGG